MIIVLQLFNLQVISGKYRQLAMNNAVFPKVKKVEIVRAVLEEHDIESMVINKNDSSYPGLIGNIEIYVLDKLEVLARFIIKDNEL